MNLIAPTHASPTGKLFLAAVEYRFVQFFKEEDQDDMCGRDLFGKEGPLTNEEIHEFYQQTKGEVELELFNYAIKEGYLTTAEMIEAEISFSGDGITWTEDKRNALAFVYDGAMLP